MEKKKIELLTLRQTETMEDVKNKLHKFNCCAIVRPTGFGKTRLLAKFIGELLEETRENDYSKLLGRGGVKGKKVMFVYPTKVISQSMDGYIESDVESDEVEYDVSSENNLNYNLIKVKDKYRFEAVTYSMFRKRILNNGESEVKYILDNYSLIVFDEMHFMGARLVKEALYNLKPYLDKYKIPYIGATATELRMDKFNVIQEYFDGNMTYRYDMGDMIRDLLICKPLYVFSSYYNKDMNEYIKKYASAIPNKKLSDKEALKLTNKIKVMYNIPAILQRNINKLKDEYNVDISYMKFIAFYLTIDEIEKNIDKVKEYFKVAFPDYNIRIHEIYSVTKNGSKVVDDVSVLNKLKRKDKTIDLIFSCNMLNYGYHVNDLTGVLMFRHTASPVIYAQQMGRPLTVESDVPAIIFDFVYNMNMTPIFKYFLYDLDFEEKEESNSYLGNRVKNKDYTEYDVVLVDELRDILDMINSSKMVGEDVLERAKYYYYATDENGNLKYGISIKNLNKVFSCNMDKDFVRYLVKNRLSLHKYDVKDYMEMYNEMKRNMFMEN